MRKTLKYLASMAFAACCVPAGAQVLPWALFPGGNSQTDTSKVSISEKPADTQRDTTFNLDIPETIELTLLMPFKASSSPSESSFDYYGGALLAARDFGRKGIAVNVNAYDITDSANPITEDAVRSSDIIIGPVSTKDIKAVLPLCDSSSFLISPLDPRATALTDSCRVIQAPSQAEAQVRDIVAWLNEELLPGDAVVVVSESGISMTPSSKILFDELANRGIPYRLISYEVLRGFGMTDRFVECAAAAGTTRFLIASENEAFVNDAIRNVNVLAFKKMNVTVYCTSKVRSYSLIDVESFHTVNMRMSASYFIDYNSADVKSFVMAYRAIYHNEPNSFAFHGYDTAHFFLSLCSKYGREWYKKLPDYSESGLQANFKFKRAETVGSVNDAIRRVVFNSDYSITVQ